ncbi:putative thiazole-containing bacteriocin maturation protein [Paenibacillus hamazuiensis]|uniref:putative thiazole-containing bacteriocin maturation protein n=1 Tax=Paenibacillus hamazuiensis TaxID=2936508 RepID=UPI00200D284A|nr:putative thiazole-containing bacteriocin maturation protein [Paenibacillus hamazuiensis]
MAALTPSARPKVKVDTFFLPVPNDGVYFRNNLGTFRMEGEMIDRWIEKLIPMFNGEHTLADLTNGLPNPHRDRVYEIAEVLHQKGFIRDASQERSHQLTDAVVDKFAAQIAFLDSFGDSGAYRFQGYRQTAVLAVGSGPFFVSLVSALLESGLPGIRMLITDSVPTNRQRLKELAEQARQADPEVFLEEITLEKAGEDGWRDALQPFPAILYVSQDGDAEELRLLNKLCKAEKKMFLPAVCLHQTGMAGPVVYPDSDGCWESAWRRVHQSAVHKDPELHAFSSTAGAMLANLIVFELFKTVTGVSEKRNSFYLLDLETLEGSWHSFIPHPLVHGYKAVQRVHLSNLRLDGGTNRSASSTLLAYFNRLTSAHTGIFHIWEEGELHQLPLSQCRVQAVDPLAAGPAGLLPEFVCSGLTHEEARREAGLSGIEAYVSRLSGMLLRTEETVGIGAGETAAEAAIRGLQAWLSKRLALEPAIRKQPVARARISRLEDKRCRFYLESLTVMRGAPALALGKDLCGFPVVWVGAGDKWYGSAGLNTTLALQKALKAALYHAQNHSECRTAQTLEASSVHLGSEVAVDVAVPAMEAATEPNVLQEALQIVKRNGKQIYIVDLAVEPFLQEGLEGVYGVMLREEGSR